MEVSESQDAEDVRSGIGSVGAQIAKVAVNW